MIVGVEALGGRFLDCPVHLLDLTIRAWMLQASEPVVYAAFATDALEDRFESAMVTHLVDEPDVLSVLFGSGS